ncbi:MAG: hypothetical protein PHN49_11225 [Candidatus Omnitrophica bacterium]|nr:hypothetical protein [Candidatus Omnitrophota bacterium]MDD5672200.1 hypothetical protein [Candidatus Omnitrophota bacterium]
MKRFLVLMLALMLVWTSIPLVSYAATEYKETALDKTWDWATTLGKQGLEKDRIIVQNKSERMKRHAEKIAKQAQKDAGKAAKDMKKKMGF